MHRGGQKLKISGPGDTVLIKAADEAMAETESRCDDL